MNIKDLKFDEKDADLIQIANDWSSKMQMVCMDLYMSLERLGITNEEDATRMLRMELVNFSENGLNGIDLAKFVFNFVNNLKTRIKNIKVN
ncbi:MAG: hypothetical protein FWC41_11560 [Firmicutes bacterium]|nr:hypothetical protein [Bacillota bacterium]